MKKLKNYKEIQASIIKTSKDFNKDFEGKEVDLITLNDSPKLFLKDFVKHLNLKFRTLRLNFKTYGQKTPSGEIEIIKDLEAPIHGRHVVLVDGIVISGITHHYISQYLKQRSPKSISILCVGLKKELLEKKIPKCYSLFEFKNEWVEGYGFGSKNTKRKKYLLDLNNAND